MSPRRPRLLRRVQLARRLACGLDRDRAARAAGCPAELLDELLGEPEFQEIVQGWQALLALDPPARTARLVKLAQLVLEEALERRAVPAALFTLAQAYAGQDPVGAVAEGLERALQRARAEAARCPPAAPVDPPPGAIAPAAAPLRPPPARRRPDPLTGLCRRSGAALRAAMIVEQGRWAAADPQAPTADPRAADPQAPTADPLGAAVHALHRAADAARLGAAPPARPPGPTRAQQVEALTARLMAQLAAAGPAQRLALERLDEQALDHLARQLLTAPPRAGPA
jgi:hypothetical protein